MSIINLRIQLFASTEIPPAITAAEERAEWQQLLPTLRSGDGLLRIASIGSTAVAQYLLFVRLSPEVESLLTRVSASAPDLFGHLRQLDSALLQDFTVLAGYRRLGIAKLLVADAIELARQAGRRSLALQVGHGNTAAVKLYEGLGFHQLPLTMNDDFDEYILTL